VLQKKTLQKKTKSVSGMSKAFIFPGQGSQSVGMGKALADNFPQARAIFAEVDEALRQNLSGLIFDGPQSELTLTANAQPALMAASLAVIRVLEGEAGLDLARDAAFVAGHSLGEYSALAAAGSLSVATTAKLLRVRGSAMQEAVPVGAGAMAALLGIDCDAGALIAKQAVEAAGDGEVCEVANDNGGGQIVVSGSSAAVHRAIEIAKGHGARRSILLPVSAPFHCSLMQAAAEAMAAALASIEIKPPCVPLIANVLAAPVTDPEEIRRLLVAQVTGAVRWRESLAFMASQGVSLFVECGAGKVLSGLVKRVVEAASALAVGTPADIAHYKALDKALV
jgi:[acyl-carrier-protein] S-malonyltransferase